MGTSRPGNNRNSCLKRFAFRSDRSVSLRRPLTRVGRSYGNRSCRHEARSCDAYGFRRRSCKGVNLSASHKRPDRMLFLSLLRRLSDFLCKPNLSQIVIGSPTANFGISNHAHAFGVADGFEAGVGVELCEDVFDVIVHGCGADVELIRNRPRAVALCQTL